MNDDNETKHISFINEEISSINKQYKTNSRCLYLYNIYQISFFDIIPKNFIISTNNEAFYFNMDMLKDTSSVISEFILHNPDKFIFHLEINDENNVLKKFEELYQGKIVVFNEEDLLVFNQIKDTLKFDNIPNIKKQKYLTKDIYYSSVIISRKSFYGFMSNISFNTFLIITKKQEYKCNSFGILCSHVINNFIIQNPTKDCFIYDFEDDFSEFQLICDFFNFKKVNISPYNMESLEKIARDLQITSIIDDINEYINDHKKFIKIIDDQQLNINSIDELFYHLYHIEKLTVFCVKKFILESEWSSTIEKMQELAASILHVVKSNFQLHHIIFDLLNELEIECDKMKFLIQFIVEKLMNSFGESKQNCSFIYLLKSKGIIKMENILNKLNDFISKPYHEEEIENNIIDWFLPELFQLNQLFVDKLIKKSDKLRKSFFDSYLPDKLDKYKEMLDSGEPDDRITYSIRHDDVESLKQIIIKCKIDIFKSVVSYNIFEDFIQNGQTNYLNYSAAYGSIKCFKYLLLNHINVNPLSFEYAVYGGNDEIIRIVDQKIQEIPLISFIKIPTKPENKIIPSIVKHQNDLFDWILEEKLESDIKTQNFFNKLVKISIQNGNAHSLSEIIVKGCVLFNDNKIIQYSAEKGFFILTQLIMDILIASNEKIDFSSIVKSFISFGNLSIFIFFTKIMSQDDFDISFQYAVEFNYKNIIEYIFENLLLKKYEMKIDTIEKVLNIPIQKDDEDLFLYLINKFENINKSILEEVYWDNSILPNASKHKKIKVVQKIVEIIINVDKDSLSKKNFNVTKSFIEAVISESIEILNCLSNELLIIDYEILSKFGEEFSSINIEIFLFMIEKSPSKHKELLFKNCIYPSIRNKNKELIEYILNQNYENYENVLIEAVKTNDFEIVDIVLKHNSYLNELNKVTSEGTPLCIAVKNNNTSIVKRLLSIQGIDLSLHDENQMTPLQIAMNNKKSEIVIAILDCYGDDALLYDKNELYNLIINEINLLIDYGILFIKNIKVDVLNILNKILEIKNIDPNYIYNNWSFLFYACQKNDIEICDKLLKLDNIDPNICLPSNGDTPLIVSINHNNYEITEKLIKHPKTDINIKNKKNKDAATLICDKKGPPKLMKFFADKGSVFCMFYYGVALLFGNGITVNKKEACKYFKMGADKGDEDSLYNYGYMLEKGEGIKMNLKKALNYYKMAADKGHISAIITCGKYFEKGIGTCINYREAIKLYKIAIENGSSDAMVQYGRMLNEGKGTLVNKEEACKYYKMAADKGNYDGMYNYASMLEAGDGVTQNYKEACEYFKKGANFGYSKSMVRYAMMLYNGIGITKNIDESCKYFKMAADEGNIEGMVQYGIRLINGEGVTENKKEAFKYIKMAADKGNVDGIIKYALCLIDGIGTPENKQKGINIIKQLVFDGYIDAISHYGTMLLAGDVVDQNIELASKYIKKAADYGIIESLINYGFMLENGIGVEVNIDKAKRYYKMAADKGNPSGLNNYGWIIYRYPSNKEDYSESIKYFILLSEMGNLYGTFNYGFMLDHGFGTPINHEEASKCYQKVIDKGGVKIIFELASRMEEGRGYQKNEKDACYYYKIAADTGLTDAIFKYGRMLETGQGIESNIKEAIRYYQIASDKGNKEATDFLLRLKQ